jgi:hypothetical protein
MLLAPLDNGTYLESITRWTKCKREDPQPSANKTKANCSFETENNEKIMHSVVPVPTLSLLLLLTSTSTSHVIQGFCSTSSYGRYSTSSNYIYLGKKEGSRLSEKNQQYMVLGVQLQHLSW